MEAAASPSLSVSRYSQSVSELNHTCIGCTVINPGLASPKLVKFRQDPLKCKYSRARLCLASTNGGGFRMSLKGVFEGDGIIIVDHGSRRKESNLMLRENQISDVEPAHMELAHPSIKDAFNSCVQKGAKRVIVSPFFLFPGRHWHQDIPSLTAEAAKEQPGVSYVITAPLGLHELLVDVVKDRITYCLSHVAGEVDECSACAGTGKCRLYD